MSLNRIDGNLYIGGTLTVDQINLPNAVVGDGQMNSGNPIGVDKARHLHLKCHGQIDGGSVYQETVVVHVAVAPGVVEQFQAGFRVAAIGTSTITVDLKKNGTTILSDIIDIDNSIPAYSQVLAGINPSLAGYDIGDVFEIVVLTTDSTGTPGEGLFAQVVFDEGAF